MKYVLIVLLLTAHGLTQLPPQNPIIGIYTQDAIDFGQPYQKGQTFISSNYVKNLEMAGSQVTPIFYHYSQEQLSALLPKLNGVFFPGGDMPININNQWTTNAKFILEFAKNENDRGRPYPVWGTCLGLEVLLYITSGQSDTMTVLTNVKGQVSVKRNLTVINNGSPLIKALSPQQYQQVTNGEGLFWFHHNWAVTQQTYNSLPLLNNFWKVTTTSVTIDNIVFLSTVEARNYPFFLTQYHPQINNFGWKDDATRTYNSISVVMKYINEFVKIARLSPNRMEQSEWKQRWIYNYSPFFARTNPDYVQVYIFDETSI